MSKHIDIVFDGPPGAHPGRFVEVEDDAGKSLCIGEWVDKGAGLWALRLTRLPVDPHCATCQCNKFPPTPLAPENPRSCSWHENAATTPPK